MTVQSAPKTKESPSVVRVPVTWVGHRSVEFANRTQLSGLHRVVFDLVCAEKQPLTLRQIERRTKVLQTELVEIIGALCEVRLLRRLNTIIESYTGPPGPLS